MACFRLNVASLIAIAFTAACGASTTSDSTAASDAGSGSEASSDAATSGADASVTPGGVCTTDADCNGDPTMSSLAGKCDAGRCRCRTGLTIIPGGRCGTKGSGISCTQKSDCHEGLDCLEFTVHPAGGGCSVVGKQCAIACKGSGSECTAAFGPGAVCFAGCTGPEGICALTP